MAECWRRESATPACEAHRSRALLCVFVQPADRVFVRGSGWIDHERLATRADRDRRKLVRFADRAGIPLILQALDRALAGFVSKPVRDEGPQLEVVMLHEERVRD